MAARGQTRAGVGRRKATRMAPSYPLSSGRRLADRVTGYYLPAAVHPVAWWLWALGLAVAATGTTNPLLLLLIVAVAGYVVVARRGDAPWAKAFRLYLLAGAVIVAIRVLFRVVFGGAGSTVLLHLPSIPLPAAAAGIRLFGDVTAESVLGGLYDGLRLATLVICVGAANALANPKRLLKSVPTALYDIGTAVVVAISVFPQLADSAVRIGRARRLRGGPDRGRHALRAVLVPVLADAMDRSLLLAAAMDSRGYGRHGRSTARSRTVTGVLTIAGLIGVCIGVYGVLDASTPRLLALPPLLGGLALAGCGFIVAGRRLRSTRYRPDPWGLAAWVTAGSGIATGALLYATTRLDPANLYPSLSPLSWPQLSVLPLVGILLALLPAWLTPPPATRGRSVADAGGAGAAGTHHREPVAAR